MFSYDCLDKIGYTCIFQAEIACVLCLHPGTQALGSTCVVATHPPCLHSLPQAIMCLKIPIKGLNPICKLHFEHWTLFFKFIQPVPNWNLYCFSCLTTALKRGRRCVLAFWSGQGHSHNTGRAGGGQPDESTGISSTFHMWVLQSAEITGREPCLPCTVVIRAGAFSFLSYSCTSCHLSLESKYFHAYQRLVIDVKSVCLLAKFMLYVPEPGIRQRLKCKSNEKLSATESFPLAMDEHAWLSLVS